MEPQTTIQRFYTLYSLNTSEYKTSFYKNLFKKLQLLDIKSTFVSFLLFINMITFGQSSSCNADLRAENDRNAQSASSAASALYIMVLTNNSSASDTYSLNALNINNTCANTDGSSSAGNVNLETAFLDTNQQSISNISINAGQSASFLVKITVANGTAYNKWCCTQVNAESTTCSNYKVNTVLHTLTINPNED